MTMSKRRYNYWRGIALAAGAALIAGSIAAAAANTTFFTSIGDLTFPFSPPSNGGSTPGTIDNMTIGATTPQAVHATNLSATSAPTGAGFTAMFASPPAIGATAPGTGAFTTLQANSFTLNNPVTRVLDLSAARLDSGLAATSATGSGTAFGVARTAGTSYALVGAATSSSAVTTKAFWETTVASTFPGGAITVTLNANYTGVGTVTAASTTIALAAYTEVGGVETAITGITGSQQITGTPAAYSFTIPTGQVAGTHVVLEATMVVTSASGANTGQINGASIGD